MFVFHTPLLAEASLHGLHPSVVEELEKVYFEENGNDSRYPESFADLLEVVL